MVLKKDLSSTVPDAVLKLVRASQGRYTIGSQPFVVERDSALHQRTALDMADKGYEVGREYHYVNSRVPGHIEVYKFGRKLHVKIN